MYNIFSIKYMLKPGYVRGEVPATKDAYLNLIKIAMPSVVEMVLSSLIGSVDTMMISALGTAAISAVGLTGQPRMIILSVFFALNVGVTAVIARRKGEERREDARATLENALIIITLLSVIITAFAVVFSKQFMLISGAIKGETLEMSEIYFRIIILGAPINALTMVINAAQRGIGNTKITMYVNIISNVVNVIFNYLLIGGNFGFPALGVAGAAIASDIGFCMGMLLSVISVLPKNSYLKIAAVTHWKIKKEIVVPIFKISSSALIEQIGLRIGFFTVTRIIADLGTDNFAVHQIASQFLNITFTFGDGIGVAGTSLVGQNLGAKRPDISMIYGKIAQRVALCFSGVIFFVLLVFRTPFAALFSKETHIISLTSQLMIVTAFIQIFQTSSTVIAGCLRGAGDTKYVALIMILCVTLIRPVCTFIIVRGVGMGLVGAWIAILIDICVRLACGYFRFAGSKWVDIKV